MTITPSVTITPPDADLYAAALAHCDTLAMPTGALNGLVELGCWIASAQGQVPPAPLDNVRTVVFAGDHGVAADGVSVYPTAITVGMVHGILAGKAGISVIARQHGIHVRLLDIGVDAELAVPPEVTAHKVRRGSGNIRVEDALTRAEAERALAAGEAIAAEEIAAGAQLLIAGDLGIGNTTPSAALIAATYGVPAVEATGIGTGLDETGRLRKAAVIDEAIARCGDRLADPIERLACLGSADIAAATGFMIAAARAGVPILVDGVIAGAEATMAESIAPGAKDWMRAGHRSPEPGLSYAIDRLGLSPILDLGLRLGEGSGAAAAVPLVRSGIALMREMATLADVS
ncbi:nicotinate-nucleotide--dimethylbenzimidazole phosphoribosyltransferase [Raineyella sp.]|uniref:nicotinate-nucleotide--dimethylbenzimidazole phosphoribosyltransferase n=1 Tax=Raineyella sp. TaxID=1911550 RepID=UPI002B201886|nr:nicotinate-nucleotide--dimethylbenzimidazole phosphoribosyltransferase [Raineyella sp.]MEA5154315.1 nicotinate-nucleotide--dimethylbenzimidazole phosphoribosyltransferase [Raineyella sp.]